MNSSVVPVEVVFVRILTPFFGHKTPLTPHTPSTPPPLLHTTELGRHHAQLATLPLLRILWRSVDILSHTAPLIIAIMLRDTDTSHEGYDETAILHYRRAAGYLPKFITGTAAGYHELGLRPGHEGIVRRAGVGG